MLPHPEYDLAISVVNKAGVDEMEGEQELIDNVRMLRAMRVIEAVSDASLPIGISQLSQRVEIPKATLARLVTNLVTAGYLAFIPGQRVLIPGPRAVRSALRTIGNGYFRRECRAVLREVVAKLGETCNLVTLDGDCVLYIERVETDAPLRMYLEPGTRAPLHCTAGGKLLLSLLDLSERNRLIGLLRLDRMTPSSIVSPQDLSRELDRQKAQGYGEDNEEFIAGMVGIAVPVRAPGSEVAVAALVCHAATARADLRELSQKVPILNMAARRLSSLLTASSTSLS